MSCWYAIQCKPREERRALENLQRQGFSCYLPMLTAEKLRHACWREVLEPLFPTYLFIRLNKLSDNWHPIRSTRGVIQLVRFQQYPIAIRDEIIERIRVGLASHDVHRPCLEPGDRVRITQGPFSNVEAIFFAHDGRERVVLLMSVLHHEQLLRFPLASVRKSASNPRLLDPHR